MIAPQTKKCQWMFDTFIKFYVNLCIYFIWDYQFNVCLRESATLDIKQIDSIANITNVVPSLFCNKNTLEVQYRHDQQGMELEC